MNKLLKYLDDSGIEYEELNRYYTSIYISDACVKITQRLGVLFVHDFPYLHMETPRKLEKNSLELMRKAHNLIILIGNVTGEPVYFSLSRENKHWFRLGRFKEFELIFKGINPHSNNIIRVYKYEKGK